MPEWAYFVKTSHGKERVPDNSEWWYFRAASILRQIYIKGKVGVGKLRTKYGTRKDRGHRPEKFVKASGKIIRTILQGFDKSGLTVLVKEKEFGRKLTKKGKEFIDSVANKLSREESLIKENN